jgi:Bifunctional DNA primase/polymerase, N-terminal
VPEGFKRATADADRLRQLWRAYPGARIGVPMGEASGLFCLDIDCAKHPEAGQWLEINKQRLPATRVHQTESGGWHYLFQHRAGLGNTNGQIHRGVDTRGAGGYVIWWAVHVAGQHQLVPAAPVPDWLVNLVNPPPPPVWARPIGHALPHAAGDPRKRLVAILAKVAGARDGERNCLLFWGACRISEMISDAELGHGEIPDAIDALTKIGERLGLARRQVQDTIESGLKR